MYKVAKIVFCIYFVMLFARDALADGNCGNNAGRAAATTPVATPKPPTSSQPRGDGQHVGVKR